MTSTRRTSCAAVVVALAACGSNVEVDVETSSSTTSTDTFVSDTTTADATSSSSSSSGEVSTSDSSTGALDPETYCAQFVEPRSCLGTGREVYCDWVESTPVALVDDRCTIAEPIGECLPIAGNTTVGGCFPPLGCPSEPFFTEIDGQVRVILQCGGSLPFGYEPCTYVEPGIFEPPECACVCDEPVETSDDGSGSSGTT